MSSTFTHTFKIHVGGQIIEGDMEFNEDGVMSYRTTVPAENMTLAQSQVLNELFSRLKDVFNTFGSIEKVEIEKS